MKELNIYDEITSHSSTIIHKSADVLQRLLTAIEESGGVVLDMDKAKGALAAAEKEMSDARARLAGDMAEEKRLYLCMKDREKRLNAQITASAALRKGAERYVLASFIKDREGITGKEATAAKFALSADKPVYDRWLMGCATMDGLLSDVKAARDLYEAKNADNAKYKAAPGRMHFSNFISVSMGAKVKRLQKALDNLGGARIINLGRNKRRLVECLLSEKSLKAFAGAMYNTINGALQGALNDNDNPEFNDTAREYIFSRMVLGTPLDFWENFNPFAVLATNPKVYTTDVAGRKVFDADLISGDDILKILINFSCDDFRMSVLNALLEYKYVNFQ